MLKCRSHPVILLLKTLQNSCSLKMPMLYYWGTLYYVTWEGKLRLQMELKLLIS
jgi:hypothetical protein